MKRNSRFSLLVAALVVSSAAAFSAAVLAADDVAASQVIAREKASVDAWQRKDKAFLADFLSDDATYWGPRSPYLEVDPKVNFLPKFEEIVERFKILEVQMYNTRVQVYGDTAVLTYGEAVTASADGKMMQYTGKVTTVYVRQGGVWRVVHSHESMNPGAQ